MQRKKATALKQEWGDKPCTHPAFAKEYDLGERTGNYVCTTCGSTFTFREKAELVARKAE
jgi:peptide methionine sulfoxide reductase MsrB